MIWIGLLLTIIFLLVAIVFPEEKERMKKYIKITWITIFIIFAAIIVLGILCFLMLAISGYA